MCILVAFGRLPHKVTTLSQNTPPVTPGDPSSLAVSNRKRSGGPTSTSGFDGVHFHKLSGKWAAMVNLADGRRKHVGLGATPEEASGLRDAFIKAHGTATPTPCAKAAIATTGEAL
jgi:hypothetical protein